MTLREARSSDASSIAVISTEVWSGTYLQRGVREFFANYVLDEFTRANTEQLISDPRHFTLVSENEDGIDGFIQLSGASKAPVDGCSEVEISTLYVQPRHHGKGIGKRLLKAALERYRKDDASSVWVAVNAENNPAIAFYVSQDFEHIGKTQFSIEDENYLNHVYRLRLT